MVKVWGKYVLIGYLDCQGYVEVGLREKGLGLPRALGVYASRGQLGEGWTCRFHMGVSSMFKWEQCNPLVLSFLPFPCFHTSPCPAVKGALNTETLKPNPLKR